MMPAVILSDRSKIVPFNEPARELWVLNKKLQIHQGDALDEALAAGHLTAVREVDSVPSVDSKRVETIPFRENQPQHHVRRLCLGSVPGTADLAQPGEEPEDPVAGDAGAQAGVRMLGGSAQRAQRQFRTTGHHQRTQLCRRQRRIGLGPSSMSPTSATTWMLKLLGRWC